MLLKTAPSGTRRHFVAAAAGFSGAIAAYCLSVAAATGARSPLWGFLAGLIAMAALARTALCRDSDQAPLRLCPRDGVVFRPEGPGEVPLLAIGVTRGLICLARSGGRGQFPIWRDSVSPDAFRRIAAYALWRRSAAKDPVHGAELIPRKSVTEGQSFPRAERPREP